MQRLEFDGATFTKVAVCPSYLPGHGSGQSFAWFRWCKGAEIIRYHFGSSEQLHQYLDYPMGCGWYISYYVISTDRRYRVLFTNNMLLSESDESTKGICWYTHPLISLMKLNPEYKSYCAF